MSSAAATPTHTPLFVGRAADADCPRHGEMKRHDLRFVVRDSIVYGIQDESDLYYCPECCLDLFALAGDANPDPDVAMLLLWDRYLGDAWARALQPLFVELGPGTLTRHGTRVVVQFDHDPADGPASLHHGSRTPDGDPR